MTTLRKNIAAATAGMVLAAPLAVTAFTTPAVAAETNVDNPFVGADWYVNPYWSDNVNEEADSVQSSDPTLAAKMRAIADEPTAVWMDRTSAIEGNVDGPGLRFHLDEALEQKQGNDPIVLQLVIYNLPGRDCYALASNGELPATAEGLRKYKEEYIDAITEILAEPKYRDLRIVTTIEPDSLPNLTTNMHDPKCVEAEPYYKEGVAYALSELSDIQGVYNYVDAAHSGWLGWEDNATGSVQTFTEVAQMTNKGFDSIHGFVTNTANTTPLNEPFLPDPSKQVGGQPIRSSDYYEWNTAFDEADWTADLYRRLVAAGFPSDIGMLVDTSRNGWGGPDRPTAASTSSDLNTYVDQSRVDQRTHRGAWCNAAGAGIGERPQAAPTDFPNSHLDAYVWVKPPGESDGSSSEIPNDEGKGFDRMCDPTFNSPKLNGLLTGALPNAPVSGKWFSEQFQELVANAYPVIDPDGVDPDPEPTDPDPEPTDPTDPDPDPTDPDPEPTDPTDPDPEPTDPTDPGEGGTCDVTYTTNDWNSGFTATVKITNTSTQPINGWSLAFTFPAGQQITNLWSATNTSTGSTATITNAAWNPTINAGQTVEFGFNGTHNGNNPAPTSFTLNGATCS
ncbi:glycoside hydrolase [Jonesia denitrificans]|nr:glycoside hydrolase family 6 protein [Jonesia denitrificans]ASE07952.2 glycoside hydrolase [Jonesia denitrificans]